MKTFKMATFVLLIFATADIITSCANTGYTTRPVSSSADFPAVLETSRKKDRAFILHSGLNIYAVSSLELDKPKENMHVQLKKLDSVQVVQVDAPGKTTDKAAAAGRPNEVHLYMKDSASYLLEEPYTIPLARVARIDILGK